LRTLYALVRVKRAAGPVLRAVSSPLLSVGRFAVRTVGVPLYRAMFFVKRSVARLLLPAKNRLTFLVSNRYALHMAVAAITLVSTTANLQAPSVRAESFGTQSMLYSLVVANDQSKVEVVSASQQAPVTHVSYIDDGTIDPRAHIDLNYVGQDYVTTDVGTPPPADVAAQAAKPRATVESYTVKDGDTLYGIAQRYGLSLSTLLWANNLTVNSVLRPGQTMSIPSANGILYTVKKGDTLSKIANAYGASTDKILATNNLGKDATLSVGATLVLPDATPPAVQAQPPAYHTVAPVTTLFAPTVVPLPADVKFISIAPHTQAYTYSQGHPLLGSGVTHTAKLAGFSGSSDKWVWPTDEHVITQYFGWKHTGIDIDGSYSTHNYAATDGIVIYASWRNGYGLCVEIDNGSGIVTRYGHHSKLFVKVGDVVKAGQAIGMTGSTGNSTGTHLHFEVIKNGKFQNPLDYLR
jgi:murein DD-endopeptidase MepM/ murein hydrolase activator NlpD